MAMGTRQCVPCTYSWPRGPLNACHDRSAARAPRAYFSQDRKSDCPQESCVSPRRNCPWTKFRSFQLIIITFPTLDLSTGSLASTKRKFLWTALLLIDIKKRPPKIHFDLLFVGIWFENLAKNVRGQNAFYQAIACPRPFFAIFVVASH